MVNTKCKIAYKKCFNCNNFFSGTFSNVKSKKFCNFYCYSSYPKSREIIEKLRLNGRKNKGNKRPDLSEYNKKYKSEQMKGTKHAYKTGIGIYSRLAIDLFGKVCNRCKTANSPKFEVHHKDRNPRNNPVDGNNWEVLCRKCHFYEHDILRVWKRYN